MIKFPRIVAAMHKKFGAVDVLIYNAAFMAGGSPCERQIMGVFGRNEHFAPKNIAEAYWKLYAEKNSFEYIFD